MLAKTFAICLQGLEGVLIETEVDVLSTGLPQFSIVGLPDTVIKEASERMKRTFVNSGLLFPRHRIMANLAPANIRKEGPGLDLALAVGILAGSGYLPEYEYIDTVFIGELALDGRIRGVPGVLAMAISAANQGIKRLIVAKENAHEASLVDSLDVYAFSSLLELVRYLRGESEEQAVEYEPEPTDDFYPIDFAEVKGQQAAKRGLEIAAAGAHNVLMVGTPGSGKTMLAKCLPTILPAMSKAESLEVTQIYSISGLLPSQGQLMVKRPFRSPHHSISAGGLVGGGRAPKPGEISLAHRGVLFLDELPEFKKAVLELLRQPMEDGTLTLARALGSFTYPAEFMLVAAMNPCPCGYYGDQEHPCTCSNLMIQRYRSRISGPLLDRIDLHLDVPRLSYEDITQTRPAESSEKIRERVERARQRQIQRFEKLKFNTNASMQPKHLKKFCSLDSQGQNLLNVAFKNNRLSARAYDRILKTARTIADLEDSDQIKSVHLAEAIGYRNLDRKYFD
ncbi:MAG: YifB family Mg chelatase-like AAA ATPase [Firmicutes bacterium]|nr:YifB family Mg chelatase-like AAA ATPase [Bacillota bacterium]